MKSCKPTLKGMKHTGYLGHFAKDKFIQKGHNSNGTITKDELIHQLGPPNPNKTLDALGKGIYAARNDDGSQSIIDPNEEDYVEKLKKLRRKGKIDYGP